MIVAMLTTIKSNKNHFSYVAIIGHTCSLKLMVLFKRYRFLATSHSFKPNKLLKKLELAHVQFHQLTLLNQHGWPLFVKGEYEGQQKNIFIPQKELNFLPDNFDCKNGDALLCSALWRKWLITMMLQVLCIRFGLTMYAA